MTREFEHIRQERSFVDARLSFLEQKVTINTLMDVNEPLYC